MIKEDYVSFEIAKLLKNKGFDCICIKSYDFDGSLFSVEPNCYADNNADWTRWTNAPTLQMVMKWLREVHNIFICVLFIDNSYSYVIESITNKKYLATSRNVPYETPECAAEAAIKYCLENLI